MSVSPACVAVARDGTARVVVRNPTANRWLAFKLEGKASTAPRYAVTPVMGVVEPRGQVEIVFVLGGGGGAQVPHGDKFLVRLRGRADAPRGREEETREFWKTSDEGEVRRVLPVVLLEDRARELLLGEEDPNELRELRAVVHPDAWTELENRILSEDLGLGVEHGNNNTDSVAGPSSKATPRQPPPPPQSQLQRQYETLIAKAVEHGQREEMEAAAACYVQLAELVAAQDNHAEAVAWLEQWLGAVESSLAMQTAEVTSVRGSIDWHRSRIEAGDANNDSANPGEVEFALLCARDEVARVLDGGAPSSVAMRKKTAEDVVVAVESKPAAGTSATSSRTTSAKRRPVPPPPVSRARTARGMHDNNKGSSNNTPLLSRASSGPRRQVVLDVVPASVEALHDRNMPLSCRITLESPDETVRTIKDRVIRALNMDTKEQDVDLLILDLPLADHWKGSDFGLEPGVTRVEMRKRKRTASGVASAAPKPVITLPAHATPRPGVAVSTPSSSATPSSSSYAEKIQRASPPPKREAASLERKNSAEQLLLMSQYRREVGELRARVGELEAENRALREQLQLAQGGGGGNSAAPAPSRTSSANTQDEDDDDHHHQGGERENGHPRANHHSSVASNAASPSPTHASSLRLGSFSGAGSLCVVSHASLLVSSESEEDYFEGGHETQQLKVDAENGTVSLAGEEYYFQGVVEKGTAQDVVAWLTDDVFDGLLDLGETWNILVLGESSSGKSGLVDGTESKAAGAAAPAAGAGGAGRSRGKSPGIVELLAVRVFSSITQNIAESAVMGGSTGEDTFAVHVRAVQVFREKKEGENAGRRTLDLLLPAPSSSPRVTTEDGKFTKRTVANLQEFERVFSRILARKQYELSSAGDDVHPPPTDDVVLASARRGQPSAADSCVIVTIEITNSKNPQFLAQLRVIESCGVEIANEEEEEDDDDDDVLSEVVIDRTQWVSGRNSLVVVTLHPAHVEMSARVCSLGADLLQKVASSSTPSPARGGGGASDQTKKIVSSSF